MKRLVEQAKAGDESAEKQIFANLRETFVAIAKRRIEDSEVAEDIAQEACITILQKYKSESFTVSFQAWAYGVLRMKIGNYYQKYQVKHKPARLDSDFGKVAGPTVEPINHELKLTLIDCMRKISRVYRNYARVLNLVYQGFGADEICRKLSIKPGNMRVILSRGRSVLKTCLRTGEV
jgi:RNA polymerase sigma-70 factor (ECF subfamily)